MATVLVVEDDKLLAECLVRWLESCGYEARVAGDAQAAVDALDIQRPAVVLLDILLPGANGLQVLHTLRSYADVAEIPVVVCSNSVDGLTSQLRAYGVQDVIDKATLNRERLCSAIAGVL